MRRSAADKTAAILDELAECIPDRDSGEDVGESAALRDALNRFIGSLPDRTQIVFVRRYWYSCSVTEIADETGMREGAVAVSELEDTALRYFMMSGRNSVFDTSDYETIKQIIG